MKNQKIVFTFLFFAITFSLNAQQDTTNQTIKTFTIYFVNATTAEPVAGAKVMIENIGSFSTDSSGIVIFPKQPDGALKAIFRKEGYISAIYTIEITNETIFRDYIIVSPVLESDQLRIALSWDKQPEDLDAHFIENNSYHISFRNTRVLNDGTAQLDRDDMDGYGPESITVSQIDNDRDYSFYVYKYSNKKNPSNYPLCSSKATVWVYGNNRLLNIFHIPTSMKGDTWNVFKIINGVIVEYKQ